jgi:demethylmenaquinone methyltransferase/2-methoxy-6-polyprenyl-1,4-benzoquinol methylase
MFSRLARRYDLGNDLISFGLHRRWKRALAERALSGRAAELHGRRGGEPLRLLDLACGTGDVALQAAALCRERELEADIVACDFSAAMLEVARERSAQRRALAAIPRIELHFEPADALALPYADASFDSATIAFGIRNVDDPQRGLQEMARVLRPGGRACILETGQPGNALWRLLYNCYSRWLLQPLGALASGDRAAYAYLSRTAGQFPCGQAFVRLLEGTRGGTQPAFVSIKARPLLGGVAWLYIAERA